jgi:hypothetical protein
MLLREDGSGEPYTHPGRTKDGYLQLPHAYWTDDWRDKLSLSAKVALLIAVSFRPTFFLLIESVPKMFGLSADTVGGGLRELRTQGLLDQRTIPKSDPLAPDGYRIERWYRLQQPFAEPSKAESSAESDSSTLLAGSPHEEAQATI